MYKRIKKFFTDLIEPYSEEFNRLKTKKFYKYIYIIDTGIRAFGILIACYLLTFLV